ncbi:MAG TPA: serine hydrolase [Steroidobacteraceae bacterium]|nr:serine hydrolase [Steroidobacteraceae bacterium]
MPRRVLFAALVTLSACTLPRTELHQSAAPAGTAVASITRLPDTSALEREIPRLLSISGLPGLSMAVVQNGSVVWARAFGTVNDSTGTPLNPSTIFEAASLSKPVFAYLVLRLADRGEFDLDRPLYQMLEYPRIAHDERYERITARIVLSHGTGLPNWGGEKLALRFDPGTDYGYSGEGFVFLQKTLERVTGRSLDELARREVFEPLGMTRSSYIWQERFAGNAAYAKNWLWQVAPANRYTEAEANAAASLLTTATDYAQFVAAVLTGRGLSPKMWNEYLTPVRETSPGLHIGLGIRVEERPGGRTFYHSGNNGRRFTSYMTGDIAQGLGLVYFTNGPNGTSLVEALTSRVLGTESPAHNRADYDRYDDPHLLAVQSVQRAAVERGADAAREQLRAISASAATKPSADDLLQFGAFFAGRGLAPLAIEVLQQAIADSPTSAEAHLALGRAVESAGDLQAAAASYQRARVLSADPEEAQRQIQWTQERAAARARPVVVSEQTLKRYAGQYQQQVVAVRNGRLYYKGATSPESSLSAIAEDLFEVDADATQRIRFVGDGPGQPVKLVGIYRDGTMDEWPRSQ